MVALGLVGSRNGRSRIGWFEVWSILGLVVRGMVALGMVVLVLVVLGVSDTKSGGQPACHKEQKK
jgi:hypothetical protein